MQSVNPAGPGAEAFPSTSIRWWPCNADHKRRRGRRCFLPAALLLVAPLAGAGSSAADVVPQTMNGVPLLPIPTFEEIGLPAFTIPTGTPSLPSTPPASGSPAGGTGGVGAGSGSGPALDTMLARAWGYAAQANVEAMGVNAAAVAATCMLESGCNNTDARPGSNIRGAFQMLDATYRTAINGAATQNPQLAGTIDTSLRGQMDPANQAIAAAQELKNTTMRLQANGISNPTVLDTRGGYNFGQAYTVPVAKAPDSQPLGAILTTWTPDTFRQNGLTPETTVGQWRAKVAAKLGDVAYQPVLTGQTSG